MPVGWVRTNHMDFKRGLLGTVAVFALAGSTQASSFHGWYAGLEGGGNWLQKPTVIEEFVWFVASTYPLGVTFDNGWALIGTVGYDWGDWRIEGEGGFRQAGINPLPGCPACWIDPSLEEVSVMANAIYDIALTSKLTLSAGAGIGIDHAHFETGGGFFTDDAWNFAYQGIAGASYTISSGIELTVDYRYFRVSEPEFSDVDTFRAVWNRYDDLEEHTVTIGLRFALNPNDGTPPP